MTSLEFSNSCIDEFRRSKTGGKMADFETLTPCISLSLSQMCTYFSRTSLKYDFFTLADSGNSVHNFLL